MNLYQEFEEGLNEMKKNSPLILTGLACVGVVATSIISIFAGKKLQKKDEIVQKKIEEKNSEGVTLTKKQTFVLHVREKWPALAPVGVGIIVTSACVIGSYKISAKRIAALTTSLAITTKAFDGYKKAAEKILGDKEKEIQREKMKNDIKENPMPEEVEKKVKTEGATNDINGMYNALQAWYEPTTNQYIACRADELAKAFEEMNFRVKNGESFVSFDEFLWALPVDVKHPEIAKTFGWPYSRCVDNGCHGIHYDLTQGVQAENGLFVGKIGYKAWTETTLYPIDTTQML